MCSAKREIERSQKKTKKRKQFEIIKVNDAFNNLSLLIMYGKLKNEQINQNLERNREEEILTI